MSNKSPKQNQRGCVEQPTEPIEDINQPALSDDWQSFASDWQSQPYNKVDIDALVKQTQRRSFWAKCLLAIDSVTIVILFGFLAYLFAQPDTDKATIAYVLSACVIFGTYLFYAVKLRLSSWKLMSSEPSTIIQSAKIGIKSSLQYIKLLTIATWLFWPTFNIYAYVVAPLREKEIVIPVIVANAVIIISLIILKVMQNKRKKELNNFNDFFVDNSGGKD